MSQIKKNKRNKKHLINAQRNNLFYPRGFLVMEIKVKMGLKGYTSK